MQAIAVMDYSWNVSVDVLCLHILLSLLLGYMHAAHSGAVFNLQLDVLERGVLSLWQDLCSCFELHFSTTPLCLGT